jgi:hypothetical protein
MRGLKHHRSLIWLGIIAAGWLAVAGSAIVTKNFTQRPDFPTSWYLDRGQE